MLFFSSFSFPFLDPPGCLPVALLFDVIDEDETITDGTYEAEHLFFPLPSWFF